MSYNGSGYLSKVLARTVYCASCSYEWEEDVMFDDMGYAEYETDCPSCREYVLYKEELNWVG